MGETICKVPKKEDEKCFNCRETTNEKECFACIQGILWCSKKCVDETRKELLARLKKKK